MVRKHKRGALFAVAKAVIRPIKKRQLVSGILLLVFLVAGLTFTLWPQPEQAKPFARTAPPTDNSPSSLVVETAEENPKPTKLGDFNAIIRDARASVVRVESEGCGDYIGESTGFVIAPGLVMTTAHSVAGYTSLTIIDANGRHNAIPVAFDTRLDVAILRTSGLAGKPLGIYTSEYGSELTSFRGVVLGYPDGGPFKAQLAPINQEYLALAKDIYNRPVELNFIELASSIVPGHSGSPLILSNGRVAGVVTGSSLDENNIGFAVPISDLLDKIAIAKTRNRPISTQVCTPIYTPENRR